MKLYKVKVRRYYPPEGKKAIGKGAWNDAEVLIEAESIDIARTEGFDALLGKEFFGANPEHCEIVSAARVGLPYFL